MCVLYSSVGAEQYDRRRHAAPCGHGSHAGPGANKLPPVEVIQKQAEPAPNAADKKAASKKKQVVQPAPQPAPPAPPPPQPTAAPVPGTGGIDTGTVMMSPVQGSAIPIAKYPGAVGRASGADIQRTGDPSVPEVLQDKVPGALIEDAQGNNYQRNLQYRGFEASPVNGVAQGLAVYQNGVRIHESFGDIVNWDFLPDNAVEGITVIGANPVFGLNALGGAVTILMRDGFNFQGVETDTRFGSFGHKEGSLAVGARSGIWGAFVAGQLIDDDGFRQFSEANIRRMYADLGVKSDGAEFHLNYTGADNLVGVTAAAPTQLLALGRDRSFTSPQTTDNTMSMVSLNGAVKATSELTFSGVGYYRWFKQEHLDGNLSDFGRCANGVAGFSNPNRALCLDGNTADDVVLDQNGNPIGVLGASRLVLGHPLSSLGTLDRTSQDANSLGGSVQGVDKERLFGLPNQFLLGTSYDHGSVQYAASSELGFFGPNFVVNPFTPSVNLTAPDDLRPRRIATTNDYVGVYFSNTTELTKELSLTLGGRWNYARLDIQNKNPDPTEEDKLTGAHEYYRFNPMAGATYSLLPGLTLYGGYSEANRAPTAAELACADPDAPCLIESFLTADPPLKQVVSRTFEAGLRGKLASLGNDQRLEWTAGLFRTENQDDIITIATSSGRGFFKNAGDTLRQGVEVGAEYQDRKWYLYANYAFVDATFQTANILSSPNNTSGFNCETGLPPTTDDDPLCVRVSPGDRLPGVPRHRFKVGADYWVTSAWKVGADLVAVSNQVFFGDEGNDNTPLAGYAKVDLRTSYNVTENLQFYGLIDNLFNAHYGLFGNYFNQEAANNAAVASGLGSNFFGTFTPNNPATFDKNQTIVPAPPIAFYGGVKLKF